MLRLVATAAVFSILQVSASACPCSSPSLCEPVQYDGKEAFGYVYESNRTLWETFHWDKLTTIAMIDFFDPELYCLARENNTRVMKRETFSLSTLANDTLVKTWVQEKVDFAKKNYLDGISLYVDDPLDKNSPDRKKLTEFVEFLTFSFRNSLPHSMVVFNVPWSPHNEIGEPVEGKDYDYLSISRVVDRIFIMEYEQFLQSYGSPCEAHPNTDLYYAIGGVWAWANMSLDMNRTILGFPCYTHDYTCSKTDGSFYCQVEPSEYRGSNCSSQIAKHIPYNEMDEFIKEHGYDTHFDEHADYQVGLFKYKEDNSTHKVWLYDTSKYTDPRGDRAYGLIKELNMNGIGMFPLNDISVYMWNRIPDYKQHEE